MADNVVRGQIGVEGIAKARAEIKGLQADVEALNKTSGSTEVKVDLSAARRSLAEMNADIERIVANAKKGVATSTEDAATLTKFIAQGEQVLSQLDAKSRATVAGTLDGLRQIRDAAASSSGATASATAEIKAWHEQINGIVSQIQAGTAVTASELDKLDAFILNMSMSTKKGTDQASKAAQQLVAELRQVRAAATEATAAITQMDAAAQKAKYSFDRQGTNPSKADIAAERHAQATIIKGSAPAQTANQLRAQKAAADMAEYKAAMSAEERLAFESDKIALMETEGYKSVMAARSAPKYGLNPSGSPAVQQLPTSGAYVSTHDVNRETARLRATYPNLPPDLNIGNTGWKIHLPVTPDTSDPLTRDIATYLNKMNVSYKVGHTSGKDQAGKGMTIYAGERDQILKLAQELEKRFGSKIPDPTPELMRQDQALTASGKIRARFASYDEPPLERIGEQGISYHREMEGGVIKGIRSRPLDEAGKAQAIKDADQYLRNKYGAFYTGSSSASQPYGFDPIKYQQELENQIKAKIAAQATNEPTAAGGNAQAVSKALIQPESSPPLPSPSLSEQLAALPLSVTQGAVDEPIAITKKAQKQLQREMRKAEVEARKGISLEELERERKEASISRMIEAEKRRLQAAGDVEALAKIEQAEKARAAGQAQESSERLAYQLRAGVGEGARAGQAAPTFGERPDLTPRPWFETSPWFNRQAAMRTSLIPEGAKSPLNITQAEKDAAAVKLAELKAREAAKREAEATQVAQKFNDRRISHAQQNVEAIKKAEARAAALGPVASASPDVKAAAMSGQVTAKQAAENLAQELADEQEAKTLAAAAKEQRRKLINAQVNQAQAAHIPSGVDASFQLQQFQSLTGEQQAKALIAEATERRAAQVRQSSAERLKQQIETEAQRQIDLATGRGGGGYGDGGYGGGGGGPGGRGGSRGRPRGNVFSTRLTAVDTEDALESLEKLKESTAAFRGQGGIIRLTASLKDGPKTVAEVQALSQAMSDVVGKVGRGTINLGARTQEEAADVSRLLQGAIASVKNQNVSFNLSTVPEDDKSIAQERTATRLRERQERREQQQARNVSNFQVRMQKQQMAEEAADAANARRAIEDLDKAEEQRLKNLTRPFTQTANTQSRSVLGVPFGLMAPAALGIGVGILGSQAMDYQRMIATTANQTTLSDSDINLMNRTIRSTPTGDPNMEGLAKGFKNVSDLGFSAAQTQAMVTEESKAATAAGSDQAAVMLAITSSMKDYNAEAGDVAKFTNTTVEAAKLANSTFETWSETTRRATAIAAAYHVPLQEVDAALVALTRHGFNTAQANTQVAGLIQNIVAPTPSAQGAIKELSLKTGIDLVGDFSQIGLNAKGLTGVLADLGKATDGDEASIRRVIPALRGGQAALLLTTTATEDFNYALDKLGQTADGTLKPVDEGFARIQQTTSYKLGQALKDLKLDAIDLGSAFLPPLNAILGGFEALPDPIRKTTVEGAALGLMAKTVQIGFQLVQVGAERWIATLEAEQVATDASTAALVVNTRALAGRAAASTVAAQSVAVNGTVAVGTMAVEAGAAAKVAATVAAWASTLAAYAIPITLSLVAGKILSDISIGKLIGHINDNKANNNQDVQAADDFIKNVLGAPDAKTAARSGKNYIDTIEEEIANYQKMKEANKNLIGNNPWARALAGPISTFVGDKFLGANKDEEIDTVINHLIDREKAIQDAVDQRTKGTSVTDREGLLTDQSDTELTPQEKQEIAEHYQLIQDKVKELRAKGAPERLINLTQFPEDFSVSPEVLAKAKHDLAEWERQYQEVQDKAKAAQQALGQVDLGQGIQGLVRNADTLRKAAQDLAGVSSGSSGLQGLSDIAKRFQDIQKAEDDARSSFDSYMLGLDETDRRVQVLTGFQRRIEDAVTAAQGRHDRGISTPEDEDFLKRAPDILGNIAQNVDKLKSGELSPLINAAGVVPDLQKADELTKNLLDQAGGKDVVLKLRAETDTAKAQIQAVVDGPWVAKVTLLPQYQTGPNAGSPEGYLNSQYPPGGSSGSMPPSNGNTPGNSNLAAGAWRTYSPITPAEWAKIVPQNSPLAGTDVLQQLNEAARVSNVDPRYLAAYMAQEGNFSTAAGTQWQQFDRNPGGLHFDNQPGAQSGALDEVGKPYAHFSSYGSYFNAMLDTLRDQPGWKHDNPFELAGDWTKGPGATGTPDFNDAAQSKLNFYLQYLAMASGVGAGQPIYSSPSGLPGSGGPADRPMWFNPLGSTQYSITQRPFSGSSHGNLGAYDLAVPSGTPLYAAAGGKVTESGFNNAGYGNSIVIDVGNGTKIRYGHLSDLGGTEVGQSVTAGQQIGLSGNTGNSTGPHLHFEVTINGKEVDPSKVGFNFDDPSKMGLNLSGVNAYDEFGQPYTTGAAGKGNPAYAPAIGQVDYGKPADPRYKTPSFYDATSQSRILSGYISSMTGPDAARLGQVQGQFGQYAQSFYRSQPQFFGNTAAADRTAQEATLNFAIAYAHALQDAHKAGMDLSGDYEKLRQVGGPIAENAIAWLQTQQKINDATEINKQAQDEIKNTQDRQFARNQQRALDDRRIAADKLTASRKDEDDDIKRAADQRKADRKTEDDRLVTQSGFRTRQRAIDKDTVTESDKYSDAQRKLEDRQRKLAFDQQVQATDLQNKLDDTRKSQQQRIWQRTSAEQAQQGRVEAASTVGAARNASAILAGMHSSDLRQKDADTKAIDQIELEIRAQTKKHNIESYDLQTETLAAQRAHEDEMRRIDQRSRQLALDQENEQIAEAAADLKKQRGREDELTGIEATRLAQHRKDEDAAIDLANLRKDEDDYDAQRTLDLQHVIDKNNELIKGWQDYQSQLDAIANTFRDIATYAGASADPVARLVGAASGNPAPLPALPPSAKRAFGGAIPIDERNTMVGDAPGGIPTPFSEIISAPGATVTPFKQLITEAVAGAAYATGGGARNISTGPIGPIVMDDTEKILTEVRRQQAAQIQQLRRELNQRNRNASGSLGIRTAS